MKAAEMARELPAPERTKLAAILARLASNHDGEVLAAAAAAMRFLEHRNLSWADVLGAPALDRGPPADDLLRDWPTRWRGAVQTCLKAGAPLTSWQWSFLDVVRHYRHRPSDRQLEVLREILERVLMETAP